MKVYFHLFTYLHTSTFLFCHSCIPNLALIGGNDYDSSKLQDLVKIVVLLQFFALCFGKSF